MNKVVLSFMPGTFLLLAFIGACIVENRAHSAPADHVGVFQPLTVAGGVAMLSMKPSKPTDSLITVLTSGVEVARITREGRVYLNRKEVHTDREYRKAMMALAKGMNGCNP